MVQLKPNLVIATVALLVLTVDSSGKNWRGITPMHSTRGDMARRFNQGADPRLACDFSVGNEDVHVVFASDATGDFNECGKDISPGTVLLIEVTLKKSLKLKGRYVNNKNFRSFDPAIPPGRGYKGFINHKEGVVLLTYKGRILKFVYIATAMDTLLCPSFYEIPESSIQVGLSEFCRPFSIICPSNKPKAGDQITFTANTECGPIVTLTWTVSAGKIIAGQGTRVITVDTTGLQGQTIWATVTQGGIPCPMSTSCDVQISPK